MKNYSLAASRVRASRVAAISFLAFVFWPPVVSLAEEGHPIAIRRCAENGVAIETMWGLSVAVGVDKDSDQAKRYDLLAESIEPGQQKILRRSANTDEVKAVAQASEANDLTVLRAAPWSLVVVDRVGVLVMNDMSLEAQELVKRTNEVLEAPLPIAVVALGEKFDAAACKELLEALSPRLLIVNSELDKIGDLKVKPIAHDTVAFSVATREPPQAISLSARPYELSDDLSKLFARKEKSQQATRSLFAELSVEQMNFQPPNGTHTPRWNAEHMMGRELLFFSQIYHALDPSIPVMDLNPKQMPKDYKLAHADWSGAEEARQIHRVEGFTRRFAYLLDGVDMRKKAPGSRMWSIRTLLLQMERHYREHSANVREKMKLKQWPVAPQDRK